MALRGIRDPRDRALFWLIYDGGLRCQEALAINLEDIDWTERAIRVQGKGDRAREMFFSRRVSRYLDDYLRRRGTPTIGPLFVTMRKARSPRRADVTADGHARLSYRQADTLWKKYTPGWICISFATRRSAHEPRRAITRSNSNVSADIYRCAALRCTSPTTERPPNGRRGSGSAVIRHSDLETGFPQPGPGRHMFPPLLTRSPRQCRP
jgi:integrase